jgi:hypothetical protein
LHTRNQSWQTLSENFVIVPSSAHSFPTPGEWVGGPKIFARPYGRAGSIFLGSPYPKPPCAMHNTFHMTESI